MNEEEQIPSSLNINDQRLKTCLGTIRESAKLVWTRLILGHYTNHGIDHSERIIEKIGKLLEDRKDLLNDYERFILLAAAYLHDIGMQSPTYAGLDLKPNYTLQELDQIRTKHNESSEKMINDSISGKLDFSLGLEQCNEFAKYIAILARYHREEDITKLKVTSIANKKIRMPFLASLLRLGDELDSDFSRVNINILKLIDIPVESKFHWWAHHYVQSIYIENGIITIIFRFPKEYQEGELIKVLRDEIYDSAKTQFIEVYDIFFSYGLRLHHNINKSEEYIESGLELIPADLYEFIINKIIDKTNSVPVCESQKVLLQRMLDFTVQIRDLKSNSIAGTGIIISADGKIATCAHVARKAGANQIEINGKDVGIYLPKARNEDKNQRAKVIASFLNYDDDIVLLQMVNNSLFLEPSQVAKLGDAELSGGHNFHSYGYSHFGSLQSGYINGVIMGSVAPCNEKNFLVNPVELRTQDEITEEMNGAAILDLERNLVVGFLTQQYKSENILARHNTAWAINAKILAFEQTNINLRNEPHLLSEGPQPKISIGDSLILPHFDKSLNNAPSLLEEWAGRNDLLEEINKDWSSFDYRVTGLIGFGGEGKSSLAREWLGALSRDQTKPQPDGTFWWGFYDKRNVDEFFEAALNFIFGGRIDPRQVLSSNAKAHLIGGMLSRGRYIFILDGLDVIQFQEGDQYGMLQSAALKEFLSYFAASWHSSFCLVTSRAPLLDLIDYVTYKHRDVARLSSKDGVSLLRNLGVKGSDEKLAKVVDDWDGHALTLSLLGSCLLDLYDGDIQRINEIPTPTADELRYDRVKRVLRHYDEHLSGAERAFLKIFSAFRLPIKASIFEHILISGMKIDASYEPIFGIDEMKLRDILEHLVKRRILRFNPKTYTYTSHPLIRAHYNSLFIDDLEVSSLVYKLIKTFYLNDAKNVSSNPTLDDLTPLIEYVYYACIAGDYDEAYATITKHKGFSNRILINQLGAFETGLTVLSEFFPNRDISLEPLVTNSHNKASIFNNIGLCLKELGRPAQSISLLKRAIKFALTSKNWKGCSLYYRNLAEAYSCLGSLVDAKEERQNSLNLARRSGDIQEKIKSIACNAWISYLRGDLNTAKSDFHQAETIQRRKYQGMPYLTSIKGIKYATCMYRGGEFEEARKRAEYYLKSAENEHLDLEISNCHRLLGDIDANGNKYENANLHYDEAIKKARNGSSRILLVESLTSRGRFVARAMRNAQTAFCDLNEALALAIVSDYRINEADTRSAIAWAHLIAGNPQAAKDEAERAKQMSAQVGYHWGIIDSEEVLQKLNENS